MRWEVNSAGECEAPVVAHFIGRAIPGLPGSRMPKGIRAYLVSTVRRCRRCEWCKMMRASHWSHRARTEYDRASRTWLGTITLSPLNHVQLDAKVASRAHETGAAWLTDWSASDQFRARCEVMGAMISVWIKRFRQAEVRRRRREARRHVFVIPGKQTRSRSRFTLGRFSVVPADFRYLLVAEMHKSGRPHFHILVHEEWPFELVRANEYYRTQKGAVRVDDRAMIRQKWQLGFTQFELCAEERQATYLCKYLAKDMLWRVRASTRYGDTERSEAATLTKGAQRPTAIPQEKGTERPSQGA